MMQDMQTSIVQSTVYTRSPASDPDGYFRSLHAYLGDVSFFDPTLIQMYDELLPKLDAALKE
jgi:hypothetical protein